MAHASYRRFYKGVKKIPKKRERFLRKITANNPKQLIFFLLLKPMEAIVGKANRQDRKVHFGEPAPWKIKAKMETLDSVPVITVTAAVGDINEILKGIRKGKKIGPDLRLRVWFECRLGNGRSGIEDAPFKIGLVDTRRPKKGVPPPSKKAFQRPQRQQQISAPQIGIRAG